MTKTTILTLATIVGLILTTGIAQSTFAQTDPGRPLLPFEDGSGAEDLGSAIPDWIKNNFEWYVTGQIDDQTLLTAMNWMFDNNLMHLSEEAAQEVHDLRIKVAEQEAAMSSLRTLVSSEALSDESGQYWLEGLRPGYSESSAGERIMQAVVLEHDANHDKWIPVLQVQWASNDEEIIDSITGKPLAETYVFSHMLENAGIASPDTSGTEEATHSGTWDTEMVSLGAQASASGTDYLTYTGLEFASETVHDLVNSGDASNAGWDEGVAAFTKKNYDTEPQTSTSIHELIHAVGVMCNSAIGKEIAVIDTEIEIIDGTLSAQTTTTTSAYPGTATGDSAETNEDKKYFLQKLQMATSKIESIQTGLDVCQSHLMEWEEKLSSIGDDAQLANIDLQNAMQKQQQSLQSMANESEMLHDTAMSIIRKIG